MGLTYRLTAFAILMAVQATTSSTTRSTSTSTSRSTSTSSSCSTSDKYLSFTQHKHFHFMQHKYITSTVNKLHYDNHDLHDKISPGEHW
mmetsp:Transcript_55529/g.130021  ORF Transcript_55529/g.130021 Transcript_55529/m.130021 type:complete len:89 (-) Transcript_55529:837-1103(-)